MIKLWKWRIDQKLPGDKNVIGVSRAWEWEERGVVRGRHKESAGTVFSGY